MQRFQIVVGRGFVSLFVEQVRKEAKQEKDEADKHAKLKIEVADAQVELMLFKLYHTQKELEDLSREVEAKKKVKHHRIEMKKKIPWGYFGRYFFN